MANDTPHTHDAHDGGDARSVASTRRLAAYLENDDVVYSATQIFDALSDSTRFQILGELVGGEKSVSDLQEVCHVSQSAISHQLKLLRTSSLVDCRRAGKQMIYFLADDHVKTILAMGKEHIEE